MPLEIMHLPLWFPFHLSKVSYWSRTVIVPLLVLMALRPVARNPRRVAIQELFRTPPGRCATGSAGPYRSAWGRFFKAVDSALRVVQPAFPRRSRQRAIDKAVRFVTERLNGDDGLGGIYPAIANSVMMFDALGYPPDHPDAAIAWRAVRKLLVSRAGPRVLPALPVAGLGHRPRRPRDGRGRRRHGCRLCLAACSDKLSTWSATGRCARPGLRPGGWAFQYANPHYPDVDDTAVVGMLLHRNGDPAYAESIERAREWIIGMQSSDGGWGAFEPENTHLYLNNIPFADHGALLDPPTADVTARCVSFLAQIGMAADDPGDGARACRICGASRRRTEAGSAAGAPTTSTAPGRCCARSTPPASAPMIRRCGARWHGCSPCSAKTAAGARTRKPTATRRTAATRKARRARLPGPCSG